MRLYTCARISGSTTGSFAHSSRVVWVIVVVVVLCCFPALRSDITSIRKLMGKDATRSRKVAETIKPSKLAKPFGLVNPCLPHGYRYPTSSMDLGRLSSVWVFLNVCSCLLFTCSLVACFHFHASHSRGFTFLIPHYKMSFSSVSRQTIRCVAKQQCRSFSSTPKGAAAAEVKKLGVIGAGQMVN